MNLLLALALSLFGLFFLIVNSILYAKKAKGKDKIYLTITVYLILLAIEESLCNIMGFVKPNSNIFLTHFYFNLHFFFLSAVYYMLFDNPVLKKAVVVIAVLTWVGLGIQYYLNPALFWQFNRPEIVIISFILISYALIHIYNSLGTDKKYFYFSIGLIMYLLCSSVIYISGDFELVFWYNPYIDIWVFNSLFFFVYQFFVFKEWKVIHKK